MNPENDSIFQRESGLKRELSTGQLTMIAIGGAIGTGLFMGSGIAIGYAGPAVIISFAIAALIAFLMMLSLSEMAVAHPTAGSFGVYAEKYLGNWAGFVVRYTYWAAQVIAIGGEATAVALYMNYWFPSIPKWLWILVFSLALVYVNARSVGNFGRFEYWFAMIKVVAIVLFIVLGLAIIFGIGTAATGFSNFTSHKGFMPNGFHGVWMAVLMAIFSFYGVEVVAVTSGEAKEPAKAIPRSMRAMVVRLVLFYLLSLVVMLAVVPWTQTGAKLITESPFVLVFAKIGIPAAAGIMNFVVLTAALSSMNTNLYLCTRMIFSLSRGGYAPKRLGHINKSGVPIPALLLSSAGLLVAIILNVLTPKAFNDLFGIAIFGGIFVWIMIFLTFLRFRPLTKDWELPFKAPLFPVVPIVGAVLLIAILLTMLTDSNWVAAWYFGAPFILLCGIVYYFMWGRKSPSASNDTSADIN
ncbi:amino acid permease [Alicyclobacillus sp. SO9]|uniref:amino acid permease n=1 Tax=Alicyclobacillus sp. SO9 TaxID=2665646 RepID=UPI0018E8DA61|nr:amino acid permease [Alicyclobacillus sp. SO9]QQE80512.1 amino acid permease [Alicyclobacillus sp. SO9]